VKRLTERRLYIRKSDFTTENQNAHGC